MRRMGMGIFLLLLFCGFLQAEAGQRILVGAHSGILVPSLNRIEDSDVLSNWSYDVGWGLDLSYDVTQTVRVSAFYDIFPIRYQGLADRSDVRHLGISGRTGLLQHFSGDLQYDFLRFDSSAVFLGGSYDYFLVDQTVNGSYSEGGEVTSYSETAKLDKGTIGGQIGIASKVASHLSFSFRIKPIFYWWNSESTLQFVTAMMFLSVEVGF
jgi:hypothetical protein